MGYDLHVTRGEYWAENQGCYISHEDWLALVAADTELTIDNRSGPCFATWSGPSECECPWFDWIEGNVYTKNPDRNVFTKMLQIADSLGATVQGDDGEIYTSSNDYPEHLPIEHAEIRENLSMPAYERREVRWSYIMYGLVVLVIVAANLLDLW